MSERKAVETDIVIFVTKLQAMIDSHYVKNAAPKITYTIGSKYVRIVKDGSAYCFIQLSNGDILKSASWKVPAKHPRGNIFNDNALQGCGLYSAEYMR